LAEIPTIEADSHAVSGTRTAERIAPAEEVGFQSQLPTQIVSSDEYLPAPQTLQQRQVEACLKEIGADHAEKQNLSRRRFFRSASGMAAAFLAMSCWCAKIGRSPDRAHPRGST